VIDDHPGTDICKTAEKAFGKCAYSKLDYIFPFFVTGTKEGCFTSSKKEITLIKT
jgi:hypothetical protein